MKRYDWKNLKSQQLGRYAEYLVKMEFTAHGLDIYTSEVDDKGIDFIVRKSENLYYDVQVKSLYKSNVAYLSKKTFELRDNLLAAIVLFVNNEAPNIYLVRSREWKTPNDLLVSQDYIDKESDPEWGFRLSQNSRKLLHGYAFDNVVGTL